MSEDRPRFGAVILAAGRSSRMGSPKQLLVLGGKPMVARAAAAALGAGAHPVAVVVGSDADAVLAAVSGLPVIPVRNREWATGLASSVRSGVSALLAAEPQTAAVLLAPCDQPGLTSAAIIRLADEYGRAGHIAAARYAGRNGAPALFGARHFPALLALEGDEGARTLLNADPSQVSPVDMEEMAADFDSAGDYARWHADPHSG